MTLLSVSLSCQDYSIFIGADKFRVLDAGSGLNLIYELHLTKDEVLVKAGPEESSNR